MARSKDSRPFMVVGWREHVALPRLGLSAVDCKIDTGARTSSLHAFDIELHDRDGVEYVGFGVHPEPGNDDITVRCDVPVHTHRDVTNSGGQTEARIVIRTGVWIGRHRWQIELNLTDRSTMGYRMLLGRTAMRRRILVDPSASFVQGRPTRTEEDVE